MLILEYLRIILPALLPVFGKINEGPYGGDKIKAEEPNDKIFNGYFLPIRIKQITEWNLASDVKK